MLRSAMTLYSTGREIPRQDRIYWTLAAKLARHWYPPLKLFADPKSADLLVKEWKIKFDEVDTETVPRIAQSAHPMCWSAGKLAAMRSLAQDGQPFIHLDGDAFLFKPLPERLEKAGIFVQCIEQNILRRTAHFRRNTQYPLREFLPLLVIPQWMRVFSERPTQAMMNMGIFGGVDCRAILEYCNAALKTFVFDRNNVIIQGRFYRTKPHFLGIACIAEQWTLSAYCNWKRITPETLIDSVWSYNLANKFKYGYVHLYTSIRRLPQYRKWAKRKLKELTLQSVTS